jgi:hypothetical protein
MIGSLLGALLLTELIGALPFLQLGDQWAVLAAGRDGPGRRRDLRARERDPPGGRRRRALAVAARKQHHRGEGVSGARGACGSADPRALVHEPRAFRNASHRAAEGWPGST